MSGPIYLIMLIATIFLLVWVTKKYKGRLRNPIVAANPTISAAGQPAWLRRNWLSLLVVVVGVSAAIWGFVSLLRPTDVGGWSWIHWLPLLIIWGTLSALIALNAATLGTTSKSLQKLLLVLMLSLFIVVPFVGWVQTPSRPDQGITTVPQGPSQCTAASPCVLSQNEDGSSNPVDVPTGQIACLEPGTWKRLDELNLKTSYKTTGIPETPFPCSIEQVYGGSCTVLYDRFVFKPTHKTRLPNYWFVASGSTQC